ncbi:MAG TPA: helix-turn-helix domain-containing protein [Terracidiphilus sp.]|nr:helix-turn-helix domain-containing protein [Terracidiphilus sp.]
MPGQDESYKQFEQSLVHARQGKNLTQAELAERLGKPQSFVSKYESGERRLDVVEFLEVCGAIGADPHELLDAVAGAEPAKTIFDHWEITPEQVSALIRANPSLRGMVLGYVAEQKAHEKFSSYQDITDLGKDDDHNRKKKGDRRIQYKDRVLKVEVKSLQTNSVKQSDKGEWTGNFQCDASDKRTVKFEDGTTLETTLLLRGEFDVLAVNCFAFGDQWRFAFARNKDLPEARFAKYTAAQRANLIASLISITWPPKPPFTEDLLSVLDAVLAEPEEVEIEEKQEVIEAEQTVLEVKPK